MEEGGTYQGTGEVMREVVVETGAEAADDQRFGGVGDVSEGTSAIVLCYPICSSTLVFAAGPDSDEGSEYQDEFPEAADDENQLDEMDVAATSTPVLAIQAHSLLAKFNVVVEPVYRLTICTECNKPVPFNHMRQHQSQTHYKGLNLPSELRLPSRTFILSLLVVLGADRPGEVPYEPIRRIQGIETVHGYRCLNAGCCGAVFGKSRSLRRHHAEAHPDIPVGERRSIRVPCQPLSVFRQNLRYVEIILEPQIKSLALLSIEQSASSCNLLEHSDIFTVTNNEREKNAVFAQTRWDQLLEGVSIAKLRLSISTPHNAVLPSFQRLRSVAREYYEEVSSRLPKLPVLVRRYIGSSNPKYVAMLFFQRSFSETFLATLSTSHFDDLRRPRPSFRMRIVPRNLLPSL